MVECTGCGRNSELIINKNNILLKVIDTNFSKSQFTMALNCFNVITFIASFLRGATQGNMTSQRERTVPEMTPARITTIM